MGGWLRHLVAYVLVNAAVVVVWVRTTGSVDELRDILGDPIEALRPGFWPIWPILGWGLGLGFHFIGAWSRLARRRRLRREARREARHMRRHAPNLQASSGSVTAGHPVDEAPQPAAPVPGDSPRFVTLLFTDLVGSTSLNETLGDSAYASVLAEHRSLVHSAVDSQDGTVVGTQGDGFLVSFDSPVAAVTAACEIQRSSERERTQGKFTPEVRIGLHAGDAIQRDGDLLGTVVNVAARVCGQAEGQQILATEPVAERVVGRISLLDRGLVSLKGVTTPRHIFEVDWDDRHVFEPERRS